jgi:hypothetical protein
VLAGCSFAPNAASRQRSYSAAALFHDLDGQTFHRFDDLIDEVLALMNAHLSDFPVGYTYRDAIALAEIRGWLAASADGRSVSVACQRTAETQLPALAA